MKRVFVLVVLALLLVSMSACSFKESLFKSIAERKSEAKTEPSAEPGSKEEPSEQMESTDSDDFQAGIPERYRLKINVPTDWNTPLPSSADAGKSVFFGLGNIAGEQQNPQKSSELPKVIDLFTVEELTEYFGMKVTVEDSSSHFVTENEDWERYLLYDTETSKRKGSATITISDYGSPEAAAAVNSFFSSEDDREIEVAGKRAVISSENSIGIMVTDSVNLHITLKTVSPDGWPDEPAEEEQVIDFARLVYERLIEKMK